MPWRAGHHRRASASEPTPPTSHRGGRAHPALRIDGKLLNDLNGTPLSAEDCEPSRAMAAGDDYDKHGAMGELDMADTYAGHVRCRLNIYQSMRSVCLAIRLLSNTIPELSTLGLPPVVQDFPRTRRASCS